jgi:BON domain
MRNYLAILLLSAPLALAAQIPGIPGQPPITGHPGGGIPDPNTPSDTDTKPKKQKRTSSKELQEKFKKMYATKNAAYRGSNIQTQVDDQSVTLTGSVKSTMQHDMALQLARFYGEDRHVVDKLVIQE